MDYMINRENRDIILRQLQYTEKTESVKNAMKQEAAKT